jgi:hypothetical protein
MRSCFLIPSKVTETPQLQLMFQAMLASRTLGEKSFKDLGVQSHPSLLSL